MYYSITFESLADGQKKNTWDDWHLIPSAPPMVVPPEAFTNYVDIPGRKQGPLDLTEVLSDGPVLLNSEGSWELIWNEDYCPEMTRVQAFQTVLSFLHGKRFRITFEEDPGTSYIGRIQVGAPKPGNAYSTIELRYTIQPTTDAPLDVTAGNYTSNDGDLPWYSGAINQNASSGGSGSGSGSDNGGSSTPSTSTNKYNEGWNAAIASAGTAKVYYRTDGGELRTVNGQTTLTYAVEVLLYDNKPATKSGSTDYDNGWNAAVAGFSRVYAYAGTPDPERQDYNAVIVTGRVFKWKAPATKS